MRLHTDDEITNFDKTTLLDFLRERKDFDLTNGKTKNKTELENVLKKYERTRYLMFWHDGSSISNHGHLLMMVSCMYDDGAFLTNHEYQTRSGYVTDMQSIIEKPFVYLIARCPSDDHQLLYCQERTVDLLQLDRKIDYNGIVITDVMRVFKGDNPAAQFESGQQKNGDYFCWQCPLYAPLSPNIVYTLSLPHLSLTDRISKIKATESSKRKLQQNKLKLYKNLKKEEIVQELHERKVSFFCHLNLKDLQEILNKEMHGIQRLPALFFESPNKSLEELHLENYEILNNEPLHDISHHVQNLYEELPYHPTKQLKHSFQKIGDSSFNGKEAKNSSDYRESLIIVSTWLLQHHPQQFITKIF